MFRRVFIVIALLAASLSAQVRPVPDGDLFLRVIVASSQLHPDDSLLLKVEITNVGNESILIHPSDLCLNPGAGLSLSVTDSSSRPVKVSLPLTCPMATAASGPDGFIRIDPDAFYGRVLRLQLNKICPAPGTYDLTFTLHGVLSRKDIEAALPRSRSVVFSADSAPLSDKVRITVTSPAAP